MCNGKKVHAWPKGSRTSPLDRVIICGHSREDKRERKKRETIPLSCLVSIVVKCGISLRCRHGVIALGLGFGVNDDAMTSLRFGKSVSGGAKVQYLSFENVSQNVKEAYING
jgi:hypothetical protein